MFEEYGDIVSREDLQDMLKLGTSTTYNLLKNGEIASFKAGREYKIPKKAVIDYINSKMNNKELVKS